MWGSLLWYLVQFLPFCISYLQVVSSSSSLNSSLQSGKLCSSKDSFALLHFKNTISINTSASSHCDNYAVSYPKTYSWKQGSDCCSWSGVTYDRFHGPIDDSQTRIPFPKLRILDISHNSFTGLLPATYFENFQAMMQGENDRHALEVMGDGIHQDHMTLTMEEIEIKFEEIPTSVKAIVLSNNQFRGKIPEAAVGKLKGLKFLDFSHNNLKILSPANSLSDNSLSISTTFKVNSSFPKLQYLGLSSCNINEFPKILSTANNLQSLDLSDNKIHGHIPNWLFNISNLSSLYLSHNFLTGIEQLPWKGLQDLDLSFNQLSGPIPSSISELVNLTYLNLSHNSLSMNTKIEVNSSFPKLRYLILSSCNINEFPKIFSTADNLRYLDLSDNKIHGHIPNWLFNISTLSSLYLSHNFLKMNNFHGSIPQTFANGCQLTTLNLNSNHLAGSLPPALANCGNLEVLDVGNNKINGTFPHWLATLPQLQVLILRSNRFYGALGDSTTRLRFSMLRILDLSHNSFTGHLQTRFFKKFQAMMSGKNNSAGMRYMGDDFYKDHIMVTMKGFEIEMQRVLTIFTAMDLSSNRFQGRIPDVVGKLNSLIVFNFSHNSLIGHIPLSMENLTELESLDLSSNKFDGKIPQELTSLTFLLVLNLSYNHLVGPIPQGNQFHTFQNDSYFENLGLCGLPMSETCSNDEPPESQPTIFHEEHDNSSWFDWKIIMMGYGSGIVIGLSTGHIVFSTGKPWWFVRMVERKVIKLTGSHRRRRN